MERDFQGTPADAKPALDVARGIARGSQDVPVLAARFDGRSPILKETAHALDVVSR